MLDADMPVIGCTPSAPEMAALAQAMGLSFTAATEDDLPAAVAAAAAAAVDSPVAAAVAAPAAAPRGPRLIEVRRPNVAGF